MPIERDDPSLGKDPDPGTEHYRAFVGPPEHYDRVAAMQFNVATLLGRREHHHVLDIGLGSQGGGGCSSRTCWPVGTAVSSQRRGWSRRGPRRIWGSR